MPSSWHEVGKRVNTVKGSPRGKGELSVEEDRQDHSLSEPCQTDILCVSWEDSRILIKSMRH